MINLVHMHFFGFYQAQLLRARSDEQGFFAKYLHAFVSVLQNKCHLNHFNYLSILSNRYNPMKNRNSRL